MSGLPKNEDRASEIRTFIQEHPNNKTNRAEVLEIGGVVKEFWAYRLPIDKLGYNIRNGRFAAEYREYQSQNKRELNPNRKEDVIEIEKFLLGQEKSATKLLEEDLIHANQKKPGVITHDGYVIDGNRRMAIFKKLLSETGEERWKYLMVCILPEDVSEADVWRIEAGIQFSRDERLDYGPINHLLKLREGISAGLKPVEIASTLYGGFTEEDIVKDLDRLKLIDNYLLFVGKAGHYSYAEGLNEHFIDLQNFMQRQNKKGGDKIELQKVTKFAFDLIRNGIPHMDLRELNDIMDEMSAKSNLLRDIENNPAISAIVKPQTSGKETVLPSPSKEAATMQAFATSRDFADAAKEKNRPAVLLRKALTSLENVDTKNLRKSKDPRVRTYVNDIERAVKRIIQALGSD